MKHKIDRFLSKQSNDVVELMVKQTRHFLIERENRLVNMRKNALEATSTTQFSNIKPLEKIVSVKGM